MSERLSVTVSVALAEADVARLDALSAHVARLASGLVSAPTRAALARVAMLRGLAAFEADENGEAEKQQVHVDRKSAKLARQREYMRGYRARIAEAAGMPYTPRGTVKVTTARLMILDLHTKGLSYEAISRALAEAGHLTKNGKPVSSGYIHMTLKSMSSMESAHGD